MTAIHPLLQQIVEGKHLSEAESGRLFQVIASGGATPAQIAAALTGLRMNGETVEELTGAVQALRQRAAPFAVPEAKQAQLTDTCGTGGDGSHSVNISTAVAFVLAGCGVPVAKHGNKAVSSSSGSADVLTALGVNIETSKAQMEEALATCGLCFLMAPRYHKAMRYVAPVRQELKIRTLFNLLGPLLNPALPKRQLLGVYDPKWLEPLAHVLSRLGSVHVWVVHGEDGQGGGFDELSLCGPSKVAEIKEGQLRRLTLTPEELGLTRVTPEALRGGNAVYNAQALRAVLEGEEGAYRDAVLLNSAAALLVAGQADNLEEGVTKAAASIDSGSAKKVLHQLVAISNTPEEPADA